VRHHEATGRFVAWTMRQLNRRSLLRSNLPQRRRWLRISTLAMGNPIFLAQIAARAQALGSVLLVPCQQRLVGNRRFAGIVFR
jgi:hypothetical protein